MWCAAKRPQKKRSPYFHSLLSYDLREGCDSDSVLGGVDIRSGVLAVCVLAQLRCDAMRCVALRCDAMRCVGLLRVDGGVDGVNISFHSYHSIPPILFTLSSLSFLFFPHLPSFLLSSYPLHSFNIILNNPHFIK